MHLCTVRDKMSINILLNGLCYITYWYSSDFLEMGYKHMVEVETLVLINYCYPSD